MSNVTTRFGACGREYGDGRPRPVQGKLRAGQRRGSDKPSNSRTTYTPQRRHEDEEESMYDNGNPHVGDAIDASSAYGQRGGYPDSHPATAEEYYEEEDPSAAAAAAIDSTGQGAGGEYPPQVENRTWTMHASKKISPKKASESGDAFRWRLGDYLGEDFVLPFNPALKNKLILKDVLVTAAVNGSPFAVGVSVSFVKKDKKTGVPRLDPNRKAGISVPGLPHAMQANAVAILPPRYSKVSSEGSILSVVRVADEEVPTSFLANFPEYDIDTLRKGISPHTTNSAAVNISSKHPVSVWIDYQESLGNVYLSGSVDRGAYGSRTSHDVQQAINRQVVDLAIADIIADELSTIRLSEFMDNLEIVFWRPVPASDVAKRKIPATNRDEDTIRSGWSSLADVSYMLDAKRLKYGGQAYEKMLMETSFTVSVTLEVSYSMMPPDPHVAVLLHGDVDQQQSNGEPPAAM